MISESQKRGSCLIDLCFWSQLTGRSTANSPSLKVVSRHTHSYALLAQCEVSGGITTLFKSNYNCIRWPSNEPISLSCRDCTNKDIISLTLLTHIIMWPNLFLESMLSNPTHKAMNYLQVMSELPVTCISNIYLVLFELALLFFLLVLCSSW